MTYEENLKQFNYHLESEFAALKEVYPESLVIPFEDEIKALSLKMFETGMAKFTPAFAVGAIAQALHRLVCNESLTEFVRSDGEWIGFSFDEVMSNKVPINITRGFRRFAEPKYYNTAILLMDGDELVKSPVVYSKELPMFITSYLPMGKNWLELPKLTNPFVIRVRKEYDLLTIPNIPDKVISVDSLGNRFVYVANDPKSFEPVWDYFEKPEWLK